MYNCCGSPYGRHFCPCCGRHLANVCPCCGQGYWGWHNCSPYWQQVHHNGWTIAPVVTRTITVTTTPAPGSATSAVQRLAGAA